jgi:glycosyltransferase involved in cell wall biosynthesis
MSSRAPAGLDALRLVQIIPTLLLGGLERVATRLTLGLVPRVGDVVVCSAGGELFGSALRGAGVRVELVPRPRPRPADLVVSAHALALVFRRERPHVVHAHNPAAGAAAALARRLARRPEIAIVTTYHGVHPDRIERATRVMTHSSDVVVGVSPQASRALRGVGLPASRSATVFNAVEVETTRDREDVRREFGAEDTDLIASVGRLVEQKNQRVLLEALALLHPGHPRVRAVVVGGGPLEADLLARARALGLEGVVTLTGPRDDAVDITAACDVFALSSTWEGLPLALLEAMTLGRPIVATGVDGIRDVIRDGHTGLLVPAGDARALADALENVLADTKLAARLGRNAREFVELTSSEETMVERYGAIYLSAAARRAAR